MILPPALLRLGLRWGSERSTLPRPSTIAGLVAFALSGSSLCAAPELLSIRLGSGPEGSGNGNSVSPFVTPDGRFVVFSSSANNLVVGDNSQLGLDVFLRDRVSQTTELVSVRAGGGGGNEHSTALGVSTNGRYVLFLSEASDLIAGDTNGVSDIFVRDRQVGTTLLVSVGPGGALANGASTEAVMTPDGRWVAFVSAATNLVSGDTNGAADLFLRDLVGGTTQWITVGGTGVNTYASSPVITPNGRYTAFFSTARGLVEHVSTTTRGEVYRFDALTSSLMWVSTNASVTTSNLLRLNNPPSLHPAISDDGRYVAFKCGWTNGPVAPPPPGVAAALVFRYDTTTELATVISTNSYPPWFQNDDVFGPVMTPEGRFIAYAEREIGAGVTNCSVRLWDAQTGTNVMVSSGPDGLWQTNSSSHTPTVSADGRYVTFLSDATNLVANALSNGLHVYRRDVQTSTTVLVDANAGGIGATDQTGVIPQTSPDGRFAVYSVEDGVIGSDTNKLLDVVLWDANTETNELVSLRNPAAISVSGSGLSVLGQLSVSGDGQQIAFASFAPDLVTNDFNGEGDVFLHDRWTGAAVLVSVGLDGNTAVGGTSHSPVVSGDGRYVFFLSAATNLVADDTNQATDLFRRDLWTGTTVRASVNSLGSALGNGDSLSSASSPDGRYVTFLCRTNTGSTSGAIFWRDLQLGQTVLVGAVSSATRPPPSISASGQRVAYSDWVPYLRVWDAGTQASTNLSNLSLQGLRSFSIAPSGDKVLYEYGSQLFVRNLAYSTNEVLCTLPQPIKGNSWSGDGRFAAFVTRTNLLPNDANGTNDVYLRDFQAGSFILVSRRNQFVLASGNGSSDWPSISADGRYVAFRSFATNITSGVGRPPSLLVFDRFIGTNTLIVTGTTSIGSMAWLAQPTLGAAGSSLTFHSWDEGLVAGDRNRFGDTFASGLTVAPADSDSDGIPDWWTLQYFGHTTGQVGDLSRAEDDADGDGLTNREEFLAGTVPTSASSSLALNIAAVSAGSEVLLNWEAAPGRNYQVLSTTNLNSPVWEIVPGSIGVLGRQASFMTTVSTAQRYFRVECETE